MIEWHLIYFLTFHIVSTLVKFFFFLLSAEWCEWCWIHFSNANCFQHLLDLHVKLLGFILPAGSFCMTVVVPVGQADKSRRKCWPSDVGWLDGRMLDFRWWIGDGRWTMSDGRCGRWPLPRPMKVVLGLVFVLVSWPASRRPVGWHIASATMGSELRLCAAHTRTHTYMLGSSDCMFWLVSERVWVCGPTGSVSVAFHQTEVGRTKRFACFVCWNI